MLKITKQNNALLIEGLDNNFYPNNGKLEIPLNSIILVIDESDMATFRSAANNDVLFSALIENITINGKAETKDTIVNDFAQISNSATGGGGGDIDLFVVVDELPTTGIDENKIYITPSAVTGENNLYTEWILVNGAWEKFGEFYASVDLSDYATLEQLNAVKTIAQDADTKADAVTSRIEDVETEMDNKQDTLVSGVNIKTINGESVLGEGNLVIEGGGSTPVTHTIPLGTSNNPGNPYNSLGFQTIFLSLTVEQYDIDSINLNDEVELTWGNSGKNVKGIVKESYFTSDGKLKYITASFEISNGTYESRNVVFYNNTHICLFPIVPSYDKSLSPLIYRLYGVTEKQIGKWNDNANLQNYYDYKTGNTGITGFIPSISSSFNGIVYRNVIKKDVVATKMDNIDLFFVAANLDDSTIYTIGKGTGTGTLMQSMSYNDVTINADGSWHIPEIPEYADNIFYNSAVYVNGELIKSEMQQLEMTWNVGDKIQVVSTNFMGQGLFSTFQNINYDLGINVAYKNIVNTDATEQLLNQHNGVSYNIRSEANEWTGTEAEFNALTTKNNNVIYYITE